MQIAYKYVHLYIISKPPSALLAVCTFNLPPITTTPGCSHPIHPSTPSESKPPSDHYSHRHLECVSRGFDFGVALDIYIQFRTACHGVGTFPAYEAPLGKWKIAMRVFSFVDRQVGLVGCLFVAVLVWFGRAVDMAGLFHGSLTCGERRGDGC